MTSSLAVRSRFLPSPLNLDEDDDRGAVDDRSARNERCNPTVRVTGWMVDSGSLSGSEWKEVACLSGYTRRVRQVSSFR